MTCKSKRKTHLRTKAYDTRREVQRSPTQGPRRLEGEPTLHSTTLATYLLMEVSTNFSIEEVVLPRVVRNRRWLQSNAPGL